MKATGIAVLVFAFIHFSNSSPYRPVYNGNYNSYQHGNDGRYYDSNNRYKSLVETNGKYPTYNQYRPANLKAPDQHLLTPLTDKNERFVHNSLAPVTYRPPLITVPTFRPTVYSSTPKPLEQPSRPVYARTQYNTDKAANIISQESDADGKSYRYAFQSDNGIAAGESGLVETSVNGGGTRVTGFYEYVGDDGIKYRVDYTADENGFRPVGAHLPQA